MRLFQVLLAQLEPGVDQRLSGAERPGARRQRRERRRHEVAHGWAAFKLGDDTAARLGRITLNPIKHVHPVGTILLPATGASSPGARIRRSGRVADNFPVSL